MNQYSIASGQAVTILAPITVTGATAGSSNQVTVSNALTIPTGTILLAAGIGGMAGLTGIFVVTHYSAGTSGALTLAALTGAAVPATGTYTSGGTLTQIGFLSSAVVMDNTVFSNTNPDFTAIFRVDTLSTGTGVRVHFYDTTDTFAGTDTRAGLHYSMYGGISGSQGYRFSDKRYNWPGARLGSAGNAIRVAVIMEGLAGATPATGSSLVFTAWIEA